MVEAKATAAGRREDRPAAAKPKRRPKPPAEERPDQLRDGRRLETPPPRRAGGYIDRGDGLGWVLEED